MNRNWVRVALLYLFIVAVAGAFMRFMLWRGSGLNFKYILHFHSHIAFLGWVFNALFALLVFSFLDNSKHTLNPYRRLFLLFQVADAGMMISFPVQGYGLYSITFSTLHVLLSYWFMWQFMRDMRHADEKRSDISRSFLGAGFFFMAFSTLGLFAMPPVMIRGGAGSPLYYNIVYFYMHFQFNGWFTFALLGLFFRLAESKGILFSAKALRLFYKLMLYSCVPAYCLSLLWMNPPAYIYFLAGAASVMQLVAAGIFLYQVFMVRRSRGIFFSRAERMLLWVALFSFLLKDIMQAAASVPAAAAWAFHSRNIVIAFLHLILLGSISTLLLVMLSHLGGLKMGSKISYAGLIAFLSGFVLSELLLFTGEFISLYADVPLCLFLLSLLMPLGTGLIFLKNIYPVRIGV